MTPYYGLPITSEDGKAAYEVLNNAHGFCSFKHPSQLNLCVELCKSFAIDNGAFSAWSQGNPIKDWTPFYEWATQCKKYPNCDFAVIPDVIDGDEEDNDALLSEWPLGKFFGAPVWHMHESLNRLERLASDWPRVCFGSSGDYSKVGNQLWKDRMTEAMSVICDPDGYPLTKFHGLRMLNPKIFSVVPFSSCDSTNIARNIGIDKKWKMAYTPPNKVVRAILIKSRTEAVKGAVRFVGFDNEGDCFE